MIKEKWVHKTNKFEKVGVSNTKRKKICTILRRLSKGVKETKLSRLS